MIDKDDWRLSEPHEMLRNQTLVFRKWFASLPGKSYDLCAFCFEKLSRAPGTLHQGYATPDASVWVCPSCYSDFQAMYRWGSSADDENSESE